MKKTWIIVFLFCNIGLYAQDDYQKWLESEKKKLETYISEEDKKFTDFLKKEWIKGGLKEAPQLIEKPKPTTFPVFKPEIKTEPVIIPTAKEKPISEIPKPVTQEPVRELRKPEVPIQQPEPQIVTPQKGVSANIEYFGSTIEVNYDKSFPVSLTKPISNKSVAQFWEAMSKTDYKNIVAQGKSYQQKLRLNDWGLAVFYFSFTKQIYDDPNLRNLFAWFMLVKSGYISRVAYRGSDVLLLIATTDELFGLSYFTTNGVRLYVVNFESKREPNLDDVFVYKEDFPGSTNPVDMSIREPLKISDSIEKRTININYNGEVLQFTLPYNRAAAEFYLYYPQTKFPLYPHTKMTEAAETELLQQLSKAIEKRTQRDALNFLLHFVQQATEYKTDDEQFGFEKPMFPEESLFYRYSDCEDRSILFSYLVKKLLHLEVVLLDFPDHIATAVLIEGVDGDAISYQNKKYLVCDPTYLGADIGRCMPDYKNVGAEIIPL